MNIRQIKRIRLRLAALETELKMNTMAEMRIPLIIRIMYRIGLRSPQRVYVKRWLKALDQRLELVTKHSFHQLTAGK